MKWLGLVVGMLVLAVSAPFATGAREAHACSCPDCDVARDYDIIVGGRVESWRRAEGRVDPERYTTFVPVELDLAIDQVFKGGAPARVVLVDVASLLAGLPGETWIGAAGACGTLDKDPTGDYFIIGIRPFGDGSYGIGRPGIVYLGDEPAGEQYDRQRSLLNASLGAPRPPATGNTPPEAPPPSTGLVPELLFGLFLGAFLLAVFVIVLVGPTRQGEELTKDPRPGHKHRPRRD